MAADPGLIRQAIADAITFYESGAAAVGCPACDRSPVRCSHHDPNGPVPAGYRDLLEELDATASGVIPDGSATLSPADVLTVLGALSIAAKWADLTAGPAEQHLDDRDQAATYRALAYRLGDDR